jgi:VCBS repeat-containing protein
MNETIVAATTADVPVVTIGANFRGANFDPSAAVAATPLGSAGAVGPNSFVELLNNVYQVYDKSGALIQTLSLPDFWQAAGVTPAGLPFDPRVLYDPVSQRWFATSSENAFNPNDILVAVSNTSDPTQGWQGFAIPSDPSGQTWADFPMLGINQDGVFIAANMNVGPDLVSEEIIAIPKSDLLQSVPTVANATVFANISPNDTGFYPEPAVAYQSSGSEPLLSAGASFGLPGGGGFGLSNSLNITSVDPPISNPSLNLADRLVGIIPEPDDPTATQKGTSVELNLRPSSPFSASVVLEDGQLFAVQGIEQNGLAALRWFEIGDPLNAPTILDSGVINPPNLNVYDASIAVNPQGDVVIGFTGSGPNDYPSAFAVTGALNGDSLTLSDPILLKAGDGPYLGTAIDQELGATLVRWGDYSATTVDPNDPSHFWTVEEWAAADPSLGTVWATQVSELIFGSTSPPVTNNDIAGVSKNQAVSGNVLTNDTDPNNEPLIVTAVAGATVNDTGQLVATGAFGTLVVNGDGTFTYQANKKIDFPDHPLAQDTFTYTATDTDQLSSQATLTVTVVKPSQTYIAGTPGTNSDHLTAVAGGNGKQVIDGSLGFEQISGGNGNDVLVGGAGDILTGGRGNDTFVFEHDFGANTITDFGKGHDSIQLDQSHFSDFATVIANATSDGSQGIVIRDPSTAGNTIDLLRVDIASLRASQFLFV